MNALAAQLLRYALRDSQGSGPKAEAAQAFLASDDGRYWWDLYQATKSPYDFLNHQNTYDKGSIRLRRYSVNLEQAS